MLLGYSDKISVFAGDRLEAKVSCESESYDVTCVRLHGVDTDIDKVREVQIPAHGEGRYPGRVQKLQPGSFAIARAQSSIPFSTFGFELWAHPTLQDRDCQILMRIEAEPASASWDLSLRRDTLHLRCGPEGSQDALTLEVGSVQGQWIRVSGGRGKNGLVLAMETDSPWPDLRGSLEVRREADAPDKAVLASVSIAAAVGPEGFAVSPFNGRIENPKISASPSRLFDGSADDVLASWDFGQDIGSRTIVDISGNDLHGELVNRPMRGIRSHGWSGKHLSFAEKPSEWSAIHFHEDDLNDAKWKTDFSIAVPDDAESGVYAIRITAGDEIDYLPFYVRPPETTDKRVLFLAPTNTYLAYANEHLGQGAVELKREQRMKDKIVFDDLDQYTLAHRDIGLSIYDRHADGSGVAQSSWNRPVLNFKPNRRTWLNAGRRHFAADFYVIGWLESYGIPFDVMTDEDVHHGGVDLLRPYSAILSGSHPEYPTPRQLDAIDSYLAGGGSFMYLGGNGWYWVTSYDGDDTRTMEVRRGYAAQRNWTSHPAELVHSSTGVTGGIYAHNGRSSRKTFGVTSAAVGWGKGDGYRRSQFSYDADVAHLFSGIDEEILGNFGYVLDCAAGDELDTADYADGTPRHARILMSSFGHDTTYYPFIETLQQVIPDLSGATNSQVRSDVVFMKNSATSKVFSVGSINWPGSMAYNSYRNNISQLTKNVLDDMLSGQKE